MQETTKKRIFQLTKYRQIIMYMTVAIYCVSEIIFTSLFVESKDQGDSLQTPKLIIMAILLVSNLMGQIIYLSLKCKIKYLENLIMLLISILCNEYSQLCTTNSVIPYSFSLIILLHSYQVLVSNKRRMFLQVLLLHLAYLIVRLVLMLPKNIPNPIQIVILNFFILFVVVLYCRSDEQEVNFKNENSYISYKQMSNIVQEHPYGDQSMTKQLTYSNIQHQISQNQGNLNDVSALFKTKNQLNQTFNHINSKQLDIQSSSPNLIDFTKFQSCGFLVISENHKVIKYNNQIIQFIEELNIQKNEEDQIEEKISLSSNKAEKLLKLKLCYSQHKKKSFNISLNYSKQQDRSKRNLSQISSKDYINKYSDSKRGSAAFTANLEQTQCPIRDGSILQQFKKRNTFHTSIEEDLLKQNKKQHEIHKQPIIQAINESLDNSNISNYPNNEDQTHKQFGKSKFQNIEVEISSAENKSSKQNNKDILDDSEILADFSTISLDALNQCCIPDNISTFFNQNYTKINLQNLLEFIRIQKPKVNNNNGKNSTSKCKHCQGQINENSSSQPKNPKQKRNSKSEINNKIYKYSVQSNYLTISIRYSDKVGYKKSIDLKIGCFTTQQLSDQKQSASEEVACNLCQKMEKNIHLESELSSKFDNYCEDIHQNNHKFSKKSTLAHLQLQLSKTNQFSLQDFPNFRKEGYPSMIFDNCSQSHIMNKIVSLDGKDDLKNQQGSSEFQQQGNYYFTVEVIQTNFEVASKNIKERMDRFKQKILCSISHELRTPLNCIISMLDILNIKSDIQDIVKTLYINPALFSSYILLNIINDILDMAEVNRSGQINMIFQEFSPSNLCLECLNFIKLQAQQKNLQLEFISDSNVPQMIYTDINKVRQVLLNLLSNALKFTQNGSVQIKLSQPQEQIVQIDVTDTGCGIPPQKLRSIFQNFNQPDLESNHSHLKQNSPNPKNTANQSNQKNAGLGLSISYLLASCLGENRQLSVKSEVGRGSTFSFFIVSKSNTKKGCTLQPKSRYESLASLRTRVWLEKGESNEVERQHSPSLQQWQSEKNIEGSKKQVDDSATFLSENQLHINQNQDQVLQSECSYQKKQQQLKMNGSGFFNQANGKKPLKRLSHELQDFDEEALNKELFPENDIHQTGSHKMRRQASILYNNLSKTTLQLIQQASSLQTHVTSVKEITDESHLQNVQRGFSSNFNQQPSQLNEQSQFGRQTIQNKTQSNDVQQQSSFIQIPSISTNIKPRYSFKEIDSQSKINSPIPLMKGNRQLSFLNNQTNNEHIEESPQPSQNAVNRINYEECFKTMIRNNQKKYFIQQQQNQQNQQLSQQLQQQQQSQQLQQQQQQQYQQPESCDVLNDSFDIKSPHQLQCNHNKNKSITLSQHGIYKNLQASQIKINLNQISFNELAFIQSRNLINLSQEKTNQSQQYQIENYQDPQLQVDISKSYNESITQTTNRSYVNSEQQEHSIHTIVSKQRVCNCPQILLVDDNEFNLYALEARLQLFQFKVEKVTSGYSAIECVKQRKDSSCCKFYTLIFMDIDMPGIDGYQTTQEIYKLCAKLQILPPIISACSAYIQEQDKQKAYAVGMSYYLTKPIDHFQFENILNQVFFNRK